MHRRSDGSPKHVHTRWSKLYERVCVIFDVGCRDTRCLSDIHALSCGAALALVLPPALLLLLLLPALLLPALLLLLILLPALFLLPGLLLLLLLFFLSVRNHSGLF